MNQYANILIAWLKAEGIYGQFIDNLVADKEEPDTIKDLCAKHGVEEVDDLIGMIGAAFYWYQSNESEEFWEDIDAKYDKYIESLNNEIPVTTHKLKTFKVKEYK